MIVDLANYTPVPSAGQVADLRALGVTGAVVGTSYGTRYPAQLAAFQAGGVVTQEYQFPGVLRATDADWWLDCETPAATQAAVRAICGSARPPRGIYTRAGWWADNMGGWDIAAEFPALELWDAHYVHGDAYPCAIAQAQAPDDVRAAIEAERAMITPYVPYAGFGRRALVQWHNSVTVCGLNVDLNEEEGMDTETRAAVGALLAQQGALGKKIDDLAALMRLVVPMLAAERNADVQQLLRYLGG